MTYREVNKGVPQGLLLGPIFVTLNPKYNVKSGTSLLSNFYVLLYCNEYLYLLVLDHAHESVCLNW